MCSVPIRTSIVLAVDIAAAFQRGKELYRSTPDLTAGALYDFVAGLAPEYGWEFGAESAGHLIGRFPHERPPDNARGFSIRHGNEQRLREPDARGAQRHWILEIHFIDRARQIGGFYEELLTVDARDAVTTTDRESLHAAPACALNSDSIVSAPVASAVPRSTRAQRSSSPVVTASCRNSAPHRIPNTGMRKVTVTARAGPTLRSSLK
jgi:hypothetical protein